MKTLLKSATMSLALGALLALSPLGFSLQDGDLSLQAPAAHARKGADDAATKTAADDKGGQRARAAKAAGTHQSCKSRRESRQRAGARRRCRSRRKSRRHASIICAECAKAHSPHARCSFTGSVRAKRRKCAI